MIFKQEHIALILDGRKTVTRRLGKKRWCQGAVHPIKKDWYSKPVGWIRIMNVYESTLGATTEEDAHREGYASLDSYKSAWERIFRAKWDDDLPVWVVTFCLHTNAPERLQQTNLLDLLREVNEPCGKA